MNKNLWTEENQNDIEQYIKASDEDKCVIFNKLYKPIVNIIKIAMLKRRTFQRCDLNDDELLTDLVYHTYDKILPKLTEDKIKGFQQLLWVSINNKIITRLSYTNPVIDDSVSLDELEEKNMKRFCYLGKLDKEEETREEIIIEINKRLNDMIGTNEIFNSYKNIFLILLHRWLNNNDYDESGFAKYCMSVMKIGVNKFRMLCRMNNITNNKLFFCDNYGKN